MWIALQTVAVYGGAVHRGEVGWDARLYMSIGQHFLDTGQAYFPVQSAPYIAAGQVNLYPPTALYLFVPASLTPAVLWWIVPLGIIGVCLYRIRPAWWTWPLMALACCFPLSAPAVPVGLVYGNTLMWTMAAIFAGAAFRPGYSWAAVIKPPDFLFALPFALRSWRGLTVTVAMSAVLLPLWFDWFEAMQNLEAAQLMWGKLGWMPLLIPVIAWMTRRDRPKRPDSAVPIALT